MTTYRKKLIEVALPLDAINRESVREKSIRHGHPSTLHLWWARRPLAACRAVLFASLVDDPGNDLPEEEAAKERERLFHIIEELVKWENTNNETVLEAAREEIRRSTKGNPPPVLDPFCGGGSIPLEAQRLGLEVYASDLNPVAVLITKALVEIPPKFAGKPPVNPDANKGTGSTAAWTGASGLAADVRHYGKWMRDEACKRIGHLYPKGPNGETIIAWLWARTVKCPNPACGTQMPLVRSFWLSTKKGKEAWIQPIIDKQSKEIRFEVGTKGKPILQGTMMRTGTTCLRCESPASLDHIRKEAQAGRMGQQLMAIVAEGYRSRVYLSPVAQHTMAAQAAQPSWRPKGELQGKCRVSVPLYGMNEFAHLFTSRQLVALTTFCDLVKEAHELVTQHSGGNTSYADAVATYLAFAVDKAANYWSSLCAWHTGAEKMMSTYARQAIPMVWDYTEANPFSNSSGNWMLGVEQPAESIDNSPAKATRNVVLQLDTAQALPGDSNAFAFTDPPYYDNVEYADLSDYFYVWMRQSLGKIYPDLFSTMLTPKTQEIVASPYRLNSYQDGAKKHFEDGLRKAFVLINRQANQEYPFVLYYAFKQAEQEETYERLIRTSTGWETMLQSLLDTGFQVTGTWPMRTEYVTALKAGINALASSIVIAARPRPSDAPIATRRDFLSALRRELPEELKILTGGRVAPVDLAQAAIGPGMAVFSRYGKVLEADGSAMTVRSALQEINYFIEDFFAQQEGDMDVESQFCVTWFQQYGSREGPFGEADVLAHAKNVSVDGLAKLGLAQSARGKVLLTLREGFQDDWDPASQSRLTAWEACQRLVWSLNENGEQETGRLARRLGGKADQAKDLAYRLYGIADRKGWADEALGYNALVTCWPEIQKAAAEAASQTQGSMM